MENKKIEKPSIHNGHRVRMRESIIKQGGFLGMPDHEVLEYILSMAIPRKDTNPIAHELINYFGSFANVLDAEVKDLIKVDGIGERVALFICSLRHILKRYRESKAASIKTLSNSKEVREFIGERIRFLPKEECYAIFLNAANVVLACKQIGESGNNRVLLEPKVILENALALKASGVIIAHNHPSGDSYPSKDDINLTNQLYLSLKLAEVNLLDHYIYAQNNEYSFKEAGIISNFSKTFEDLKGSSLNKPLRYEG